MLVVDASVVAKVFVEEEGSASARRVWSEEESLVIPAHGLAEVGEVLARKCREGQISRKQMEEAAAGAARSLLQAPVGPLLKSAAEIALEFNTSVYDSLYVALAQKLGCALLTADRRLIAKMVGTHHAALIRPLDSR